MTGPQSREEAINWIQADRDVVLALEALLAELVAQDDRIAELEAGAVLVVQTLRTVAASRLPAVQRLARLVGH